MFTFKTYNFSATSNSDTNLTHSETHMLPVPIVMYIILPSIHFIMHWFYYVLLVRQKSSATLGMEYEVVAQQKSSGGHCDTSVHAEWSRLGTESFLTNTSSYLNCWTGADMLSKDDLPCLFINLAWFEPVIRSRKDGVEMLKNLRQLTCEQNQTTLTPR